MDKKTKKEFKKLDKEVKDLHKTTIQVNNRFQKIMGLKNEEGGEESDEENDEVDDYLNNVNEEEVSEILQKAEQEMKEEEEEKKRQQKENEENKDKMEKMLKEELENISDEEKKKKKKKKEKKKKEKNNSDENSENNDNKNDEESYKEFIEFQKWKKMKELQKEKQKEEDNNNNIKQKEKEKEENENNNINNNIKEISDIKTSKKENKEKDIKKEVKNEQKNKEIKQENNEDNKEEAKEKEFDFNINNINNNDNINNQPINNNNNDNNNNLDNNNNNNNNIPKNNKPEQIIPKNVYDKISANDKKFVADLLKACNAKYQEGEAFASMGKYTEALKCYSVAKNLFLKSNKVIQSKKNVYPKEFMMKITSIISDKLKLVHQAAKNCSNAIKEKIINKANLRNNNNNFDNNIDNNNIDNNNINNNVNNNNIDNNKNNNNEYKINNNKINNKPNLDKNDDKNINNYNFDFNELNNNNKNNNNNKIRNQNAFNNNNNNSNQNNKPKSLHDKEEDAMDEKILSEIMTKNPGVKFSDIIGMNDMKQTLYEIIVVPTIRPDLFTGIRTPQRGILLFGPPGTGKTMIAKAIASECGSTFFNISASSLTSKWVGESEKTVKSLFKIAYQKVPSIIFIDEIDSILSKRSESENEATKRLKTEFLIQFDGLGSNTSARLLVIAATNRPMDLDEALLRRLPKRVYCGPLDEDGRFEFIKKVINRVETDLSDEDIKEIAKMTNDYSNSDLMELCREAAYRPVRELTNDEILKLDKFRPINKKDLLDAVHKIRGTLSKKVKEDLRKWNEQFGGV